MIEVLAFPSVQLLDVGGAGIDLALALVEDDLGRVVAFAVARYLVVFLKRPSGRRFNAALSLQSGQMIVSARRRELCRSVSCKYCG